jgi:hypothetical protein
VNRSRTRLGKLGILVEGGLPVCPGCRQRLEFGTDGQGRTTESCACGYRAYTPVRSTDPKVVLPQ